MICSKCNQKLPDDSEFCQYCGKRIEKENTEKPIINKTMENIIETELPDIENVSSEKAVDAVIKIQAEETIKNFKENKENQLCNEDDSDFGLVPEKPIYTLAYMSVEGEIEYLSQLYTENGIKIRWNRRGSISVNGISGMIDVYDTYLPSGEKYKTIYINMYGAKKSKKAPIGFILKNFEAKEGTEELSQRKKAKTKFCSRCGSSVDFSTKKCTGCGKQYFKGVKFNKGLIAVLILSIIILASVILNIVQFIKMDELNENKEYYKKETSDQLLQISNLKKQMEEKDNKLNFYEKHIVIVSNNGTKKYHKYGCNDLDVSHFWAYNIEAAKSLEYYACSECNPGKTASQLAIERLRKKYGIGQ